MEPAVDTADSNMTPTRQHHMFILKILDELANYQEHAERRREALIARLHVLRAQMKDCTDPNAGFKILQSIMETCAEHTQLLKEPWETRDLFLAVAQEVMATCGPLQEGTAGQPADDQQEELRKMIERLQDGGDEPGFIAATEATQAALEEKLLEKLLEMRRRFAPSLPSSENVLTTTSQSNHADNQGSDSVQD